MTFYEFAVLGGVSSEQRATFASTIAKHIEPFQLALGSDVVVHDGASVVNRDRRAAFAAVYFGCDSSPHTDVEVARKLVQANAPVIPFVSPAADFARVVPDFLQYANGLTVAPNDTEMLVLGAAMLESVGLLRRQRRVFVSYRRAESRATALQMHDLLAMRGFDVFLDTHDIRPGDPFQDVLWHRLVDSDVLIMLDTPGYFDSRWTRQEIGRARAKEIQVLRVVWPDHHPHKLTDLSETIYLEAADVIGSDGPIVDSIADTIALRVEQLRSRSIAARFMSITGKVRADVERIGARFEGIGAHRAISIRLLDERRLWAYPVVGVPTAETLNDVADKALAAPQTHSPVVVYDHFGIQDSWAAHLRWLGTHIRSVRALKVTDVAWELAAWETEE